MQSLYGAIANYKSYYMEKNKSKGLGDTIAKLTKATGIKKVESSIIDDILDSRGVLNTFDDGTVPIGLKFSSTI